MTPEQIIFVAMCLIAAIGLAFLTMDWENHDGTTTD
jgi:hypothetical protein